MVTALRDMKQGKQLEAKDAQAFLFHSQKQNQTQGFQLAR